MWSEEIHFRFRQWWPYSKTFLLNLFKSLRLLQPRGCPLQFTISNPIFLPSSFCDANHRDHDLARGEIYGHNMIRMAVVIGIPGKELIAAIIGVLLDLGKMGDKI